MTARGATRETEALKMIIYGSGILIDGKDLFGDQRPHLQNYLGYANDLTSSGRYYMGEALELSKSPDESKDWDKINNLFHKAVRRLVEAEFVLKEIQPAIHLDMRRLDRLFSDFPKAKIIPSEFREDLTAGFRQLDGKSLESDVEKWSEESHINQARSFLIGEAKKQVLRGILSSSPLQQDRQAAARWASSTVETPKIVLALESFVENRLSLKAEARLETPGKDVRIASDFRYLRVGPTVIATSDLLPPKIDQKLIEYVHAIETPLYFAHYLVPMIQGIQQIDLKVRLLRLMVLEQEF